MGINYLRPEIVIPPSSSTAAWLAWDQESLPWEFLKDSWPARIRIINPQPGSRWSEQEERIRLAGAAVCPRSLRGGAVLVMAGFNEVLEGAPPETVAGIDSSAVSLVRQECGPETVVVVVPALPSSRVSGEGLKEIVAAVAKKGAEKGFCVVDTSRLSGKRILDGVHLGPEGREELLRTVVPLVVEVGRTGVCPPAIDPREILKKTGE